MKVFLWALASFSLIFSPAKSRVVLHQQYDSQKSENNSVYLTKAEKIVSVQEKGQSDYLQ